jgi:hypothetical protein
MHSATGACDLQTFILGSFGTRISVSNLPITNDLPVPGDTPSGVAWHSSCNQLAPAV